MSVWSFGFGAGAYAPPRVVVVLVAFPATSPRFGGIDVTCWSYGAGKFPTASHDMLPTSGIQYILSPQCAWQFLSLGRIALMGIIPGESILRYDTHTFQRVHSLGFDWYRTVSHFPVWCVAQIP
jgi:hypothetical protein